VVFPRQPYFVFWFGGHIFFRVRYGRGRPINAPASHAHRRLTKVLTRKEDDVTCANGQLRLLHRPPAY